MYTETSPMTYINEIFINLYSLNENMYKKLINI